MNGCIRWGFAGASKACQDFITAMSLLPAGENMACAISARSLERAQEFAKRFDIPKAYGSYEDMANDPDLDIVYVGTIHPTHKYITELMLNAGKNVLCEKPLTMNLKQTKEVIDLAKKKNLFLMEAMWSLFFPVYHELRELLKNGDTSFIGTPTYMYVTFGFPGIKTGIDNLIKKELGGGTLLDLGCYVIRLSSLVFGGKPERICASGILHDTGVDATASITLYYSGNRQAQLNTSLLWLNDNKARLAGTKGVAEISKFWCPNHMRMFKKPKDGTDDVVYNIAFPDTHGKKFNYINSVGFTYEIKAVREALLAGKKEHPYMTHEDSIVNAEILDEIRRQIGVVFDEDKE